MIEKTYDAAEIEPRIADRWEAADAFRAGSGAAPEAEPFSIVLPPPNVTGSLHIGHAFDHTIQDILVRHRRMLGQNVLWQPGLDHAGIATQMVVERRLAERRQPGRREMGREAFVSRVWEWKAESGGSILRQDRRLGASCDWSRERFTMDEGLSQAVVKVFVDLYRKGLVYRDKRLVNWDTVFQSAISDIEVESREVDGHLWHFRYPVEGATFDPQDAATFVTVATTRPETMLGDAAVAVHPDDDRYRFLVGRNVVLPIVGRRVPIVADTYSDPEKGTGAVKITPAHDFNDAEVGKRHGLPTITVLSLAGAVAILENADFRRGVEATPSREALWAQLEGLDRFAARERIVELMEQGGFLAKIEPHTHMVPHGDRSNSVIEPMLTDQWYVNAAELAKPAIAAVRDGRTEFVPKNWEKTYYDWMENIQPWCISRQLWWGHRIPAWYGPDGTVFVAASEEEAVAEAARHYGSAPARLERDEDVLDTWFSSGLWPFSTLGWPEKTPELATYYPTSVLVSGFDIIFYWVARMMMLGLHCVGEVPFRTVHLHALVRDKHGAKMSKSKGNVIDPLELIDEYGADAVRFTLAILAAPGRDVKLDPQRIAGYRNFGTKLWNATRFAEMNEARHGEALDPATLALPVSRWLLTELSRTVREVDASLAAFRFNDAAGTLYRFVWNTFCDWYVELSKPIHGGTDESARDETRRVTGFVIDRILVLLHPFMPFLTEELWGVTAPAGRPRETLLCHARWPAVAFEDKEAAADVGWLVELVSEIRSIRTEMNVPPGAEARLVAVQPDQTTAGRLEAQDAALRRLARLATVEASETAPPSSVQIVVGSQTFALPLEGMIDVVAERGRLGKAIGRCESEVERSEKKLSNERFVASAPPAVVAEEREKLDGYRDEASKLRGALARLEAAS